MLARLSSQNKKRPDEPTIGSNSDPSLQARSFLKKALNVCGPVFRHCFARNCVAACSVPSYLLTK
jgi:hypothetical protein